MLVHPGRSAGFGTAGAGQHRHRADIAWDAVAGAARYDLLRSGIQIATAKASIVDGGPLADTVYDHAVRAYTPDGAVPSSTTTEITTTTP